MKTIHFYESVLNLPIGLLDYIYNKYIVILNEIDKAHDESHIFHTCMNAQDIINRTESLDSEDKLIILTAAYTHDIGCVENRDEHHILGKELVKNLLLESYNEYYNETSIKIIGDCILKHRASYKGSKRTLLEEIVAMADRGAPLPKPYFKRSYLYAKDKLGQDHENALKHSLEHIGVEKFGVDGYAWKDGLLEKYYPKESSDFKTLLSKITSCKEIEVYCL